MFQVLLGFASMGGTSVELAAWELGISESEVQPLWQELLDEGLIAPSGSERGETMYQLTPPGQRLALAPPDKNVSPRRFTALIKLVYISRALAPMSDAELADLLTVARSRNEAEQVTGMLVYARASFMQVLEGTPHAVASIFRRITADQRHADVRILTHAPIAARRYGQWSMSFRALDSDELAARMPGYSWPPQHPLIAGVPSTWPDDADALLDELAPPA